MLKIEEGMYVRTKKGEIKKILQYDEQKNNLMWCTLNHCATIKSSIIKASYNIIDLIEVGDYVNGYSVIEKPYSYLGIKFISLDTDTSWGWGKGEMPAENIKSVLTREQFNNEKYVVNEVE